MATTKYANAVSAIILYLKSLPEIDEWTDGRIWGSRLPDGEASSMPRACIIVRPVGGGALGTAGTMPTTDESLDVRTYAQSEFEAHQLAVAVSAHLHQASHVGTNAGRIIWCRRASSPLQAVEPDTEWPFTLTTWQVYGAWLIPDELK